MAILSYEKLEMYDLSSCMLENFKRLQDFDIYHCLLAGTLASTLKIQSQMLKFPQAFLKWIKICDGGLLFDTTMLSSKSYDKDLDLPFSSIEEHNTVDAIREYGLPDGYFVFAVRSYGDPICFKKRGEDERVYLWNREEEAFEEVWDTFEDWLTEEIDTGIQLIAEDVLDPLDIKLIGEDDGI